MTSEELEAIRENTIAGNQQTLATLTQLQAQALQISADLSARMNGVDERLNSIEAILASVLERLDRLEQLNQRAIGFATRDG
ncbi:MAG: hypothetical protein F4Y88_06725 [Chloroflexi bacterium]|nr:hypothetical protein [Chloroflexota bacterium]